MYGINAKKEYKETNLFAGMGFVHHRKKEGCEIYVAEEMLFMLKNDEPDM